MILEFPVKKFKICIKNSLKANAYYSKLDYISGKNA